MTTKETLYVDKIAGAYEGFVYSDGDRYRVIRKYDLCDIERYAKRNDMTVLIISTK